MTKGYKVFNEDWTCRGKKYECPAKFEEEIENLCVCSRGMHFCKVAADCFNYYTFDPHNHVCEVIAYGEVAEDGDKCCTDKLEIVREISWEELLTIVNSGASNSGLSNSGDFNSGNRNSGDCNSGDFNSGNRNSGNRNSGNRNSGDFNSGDFNSGNCNSGDFNSGNCNSGNFNSGDCNSGDFNSGDFNSGDCNSGDFNKTYRCSGVFCTEPDKIRMFNKPTDWTYDDWRNTRAYDILLNLPRLETVEYIYTKKMTDEEKKLHPEYETTGGYLKVLNEKESNQLWWNGLTPGEKEEIFALPNFDKVIFEKILGIEVE